MTETGSHPAVFAGLWGSSTWAIPTLAFATPADNFVHVVSESLVLQFVVGCAAGALLAGAVAFVYDRVVAFREDRDEREEDLDFHWSSSSLNLVRDQQELGQDDPTGDLGRYRTGQITIDFPAQREAATSEPRRPRHSAASPKVATRPAPRRQGRHFATTAKAAPAVPFLSRKGDEDLALGRHFATSVAARMEELAREQAQAKVGRHYVGNAPKAPEPTGRARLASLPRTDDVPRFQDLPAVSAAPIASVMPTPAMPTPAPAVSASPSHAATDKHSSLGITGRLYAKVAERTRSVREVLSERLSSDAMDGVPVIKRADGTSNNVTPTWFDQSFVPALASITGIGKLEDTAPRLVKDPTSVDQPVVEEADSKSRASYISSHVAEVDEGVFPELRSADDLEHEDVWEQALAAMGESIRQSEPVFQDVVGGPSTIDDPDGLEGPTGFIPFRVPAGRPDVVDTESYIDYLLGDELSHNSSQVLRRSSRSYLRVIEGGTNPLRLRKAASETGPQRTGRHFSQQRYAREA